MLFDIQELSNIIERCTKDTEKLNELNQLNLQITDNKDVIINSKKINDILSGYSNCFKAAYVAFNKAEKSLVESNHKVNFIANSLLDKAHLLEEKAKILADKQKTLDEREKKLAEK